MKRFGLASFAGGVLTFAALSIGPSATAQAGWGFGFNLFGPHGGFSFHQHAPLPPPPVVHVPPPVRVYHYSAPDCYGPACYDPPCFRPHFHHHHHHHGW